MSKAEDRMITSCLVLIMTVALSQNYNLTVLNLFNSSLSCSRRWTSADFLVLLNQCSRQIKGLANTMKHEAGKWSGDQKSGIN